MIEVYDNLIPTFVIILHVFIEAARTALLQVVLTRLPVQQNS